MTDPLDPDIDAIVAKLQERWPYIDICQEDAYDRPSLWQELVRNVLEIAAELERQ